ncbi:hypothetical protein X777_14875 [Ooceraea biroi]|uniref:Uncharacterized protein n=1 Tax=Ooceraea biroi TaxID=2015173 RepID=A0A026WSR4_OOCBI|nr:hypothetical protein X777_14875 [Ooceraea biroi]
MGAVVLALSGVAISLSKKDETLDIGVLSLFSLSLSWQLSNEETMRGEGKRSHFDWIMGCVYVAVFANLLIMCQLVAADQSILLSRCSRRALRLHSDVDASMRRFPSHIPVRHACQSSRRRY